MTEATISITLKINHALENFISHDMIDREMKLSIQRNASIDFMLREIVGLSEKIRPLILVNGKHADRHAKLKSGDRVTLWMPMAGG
jgi:hypothetical protein